MSNESVISASRDYILEKYIHLLLNLEQENAKLKIELAYSESQASHYKRVLDIYEKPLKDVKKLVGGGHHA